MTETLMTRDAELAMLRTPPHSMEAEQSVLGGLLIDNLAYDTVGDLVVERDYYRREHRLIHAAIAHLLVAGKPADVITVHARLLELGQGDDVGGLGYLNALAQAVPSASHTRRYAEIVRERAVMRQLLSTTDEVARAVLHPQGRSAAELLDEAESRVLRISEQGGRGRQHFLNMDALVVAMLDQITERAERGAGDVTGVATGLLDLDRMTAGLQPGDLVVLAARPSMGKTALALNITEHVGVTNKCPVLVFSMEMGGAQLTLRMAGSIARIDQGLLRTGKLGEHDWLALAEAAERLGQAPIHIDETPTLTINELRARARRQARAVGPLGLIVVDYLQLMSGGSDSEDNRATELGAISRGLKALGKELNCPVLALSQLNRSVESRNDKRPMLSDLRESGAIEQDADIVMFIYRDEYYTKDDCKEPGVAELIVAKQRNGPVGTVRLGFERMHTKFNNLAHSVGH